MSSNYKSNYRQQNLPSCLVGIAKIASNKALHFLCNKKSSHKLDNFRLERVKGKESSASSGRRSADDFLWERENLSVAQRRPNSNRGSQTKRKRKHPNGCFVWSGWRESDPRNQLGRLGFYHWTTPAFLQCFDSIAKNIYYVN